MREVVHELRRSFQFILIDSPPVVGISDAAVLSVMSDGVLVVLNGQKTSTAAAQKAVERLDMVRARLLGVILNGVDLKDPHYSYFRSYETYYTYKLANEDGSADGNGNGALNGYTQNPPEQSQAAGRVVGGSPGVSYKDVSENGSPAVGRVGPTAESAGNPLVHNGDEAMKSSSISRPRATAPVTGGGLNRIVDALNKTMGPIALTIVQEHVAALGESRYAFPESRIDELLKSLESAITDDELKSFSKHLSEKSLSA
jgi:hypothetical protein